MAYHQYRAYRTCKDASRAHTHSDDYKYLFEFIRNKRIAGEPVCYGCSHYLGMEYEREVRDWYYLCTAGLTPQASWQTEISPPVSISSAVRSSYREISSATVSGTSGRTSSRYSAATSADFNEVRSTCEREILLSRDSYHSWDFDNNKPQVCFKDILF